MFEAKQTFCGQRKRYGDSFYVWEVTTNRNEAETVEWCFENLYKRRVPESAEFHRNIKRGGEKDGDMGYYFGGYYSLKAIDGGFQFEICNPFAD